MKLYRISGSELHQVASDPFKLEKDIQSLVEANVGTLFDLEFVRTELAVQNFRFDTLCFDPENKSFVIIEYKKGSSYSVIDQGYTYLSLMLNNKADFILEYNEVTGNHLKRDEIDWSQSRVIFISPKFSEYQKHSVNFKNVPFELWEVKRFKDGILGLQEITTDSDADISSTIAPEDTQSPVSRVSKEVVKIDEDYHLYKAKNRPEWVVELYRELKRRIMALGDDVEVHYKKQTIGFKDNNWLADLIIYNKGIGVVISLKKGELNDYLNLTEDLSDKGHWGNGEYRIWLHGDEHLEYAVSLVKQAFDKQKS